MQPCAQTSGSVAVVSFRLLCSCVNGQKYVSARAVRGATVIQGSFNFFDNLIFVELDGIFGRIMGSVCKRFCSS